MDRKRALELRSWACTFGIGVQECQQEEWEINIYDWGYPRGVFVSELPTSREELFLAADTWRDLGV
jgi:hypothetical protein